MFSFDVPVHSAFSGIQSHFLNTIFYGASCLFNPLVFIVLLVVSAAIVYRYYGKKETLVFIAAPLVTFLITYVLKYVIGAARPVDEHIYAFGSSFPSGHTSVATAYFLMMLHFLKHSPYVTKAKGVVRTFRLSVHYAFCLACPLFVGVSRLYFGVHWLSDVIGGYIVGALVVYCVIRFLDFKPKRR